MSTALTEESWKSLHDEASLRRLCSAIGYFSDADCVPIVLKGWAIARFYDRGKIRTYTDLDLAFAPEEQECVLTLLSSFADRGNSIDVHFGLRGLDNLPWGTLLARSYTVEVDGTPVRVLADEDNLRLTAVHWLTDGGVNRERLWDIYYLVNNRNEDFDWERCLESNGPVRRTWIMAAIATARDHLGLDVTGLPEEIQNLQLPSWYKKTLEREWKRGVYSRRLLSTVLFRPKLLFEQLHRRFPPNKIAATIDTESPIDDSSRLTAQVGSFTNKILPFARGVARRLSYSRQGDQD